MRVFDNYKRIFYIFFNEVDVYNPKPFHRGNEVNPKIYYLGVDEERE